MKSTMHGASFCPSSHPPSSSPLYPLIPIFVYCVFTNTPSLFFQAPHCHQSETCRVLLASRSPCSYHRASHLLVEKECRLVQRSSSILINRGTRNRTLVLSLSILFFISGCSGMICNILPQLLLTFFYFFPFPLFATLANNKDERYRQDSPRHLSCALMTWIGRHLNNSDAST